MTLLKTHVYGIEKFRVNFQGASRLQTRWVVIAFLFSRWHSLFACRSVHKVSRDTERLSDESGGRREIICIWPSIYRFPNTCGGSKISMKSSFMEDSSLSVHSVEVMYQAKVFLFGVNCRLSLSGLGRKEMKVRSKPALLLKRLRYHMQLLKYSSTLIS